MQKLHNRRAPHASPVLLCLALGALSGLRASAQGSAKTVSDADFEPRACGADALRADVDLLRRALEHVHPALTRCTARATLERGFDALRARCADGMDELAFYRAVSELCAQIRCGHTRVMAPAIDAYRNRQATQLPFTFRIFGDEMIVDAVAASAAKSLARGDRITAIEGVPVARLLREIGATVCLDGFTDAARASRLDSAYEFADSGLEHYLPCWIGMRSLFRLRISRGEDTIERTVGAIGRAAWSALRPRVRNFKDACKLRKLEDDKALLEVGTFVNYRKPVDATKLYAGLFSDIAQWKCEHLIVDLRSNGGGSDDASRPLLRFLLSKYEVKTRPPIVANYRCPEDLQKQLSTWVEGVWSRPAAMFKKVEAGYEVPLLAAGPREIRGHEARFRGRITVLTSRYNASGSTMLLARLQDAGVRLVGEATAGAARGPSAGVLMTLKLPASRLTINIPLLRQRTGLDRFEEGKGVQPDQVVQPTRADFLARRDPVLQAARAQK